MALFSLILLVLYSSAHYSRTAQRKQASQQDAFTATLLAGSIVESQLRGARVTAPAPGTPPVGRLEYLRPQLDDDGNLVVTASGEPQWGPPVAVFQQGESLVLETQGDQRNLVRLGPSGEFIVRRLSAGLLELEVRAEFPDERVENASKRTSVRRIELAR